MKQGCPVRSTHLPVRGRGPSMVGSLAGAAASQKVTEVRNVGVARVVTRCNTCNSVPQLTEAGTPASATRRAGYAIVIRYCCVERVSLNG